MQAEGMSLWTRLVKAINSAYRGMTTMDLIKMFIWLLVKNNNNNTSVFVAYSWVFPLFYEGDSGIHLLGGVWWYTMTLHWYRVWGMNSGRKPVMGQNHGPGHLTETVPW